MKILAEFKSVWVVDFEFQALNGERPKPLCLVARELRSKQLIRVWLDGQNLLDTSPYPLGGDSLFVAYYASAELGCHIALGWPMPERILDLFAEFRCLTSGLPTTCGSSLLGAMTHFGLGGMEAAEKDTMRDLALRGGPYAEDEKLALLDYCQTDVDSLVKLLQEMLPRIDLPRALLRGRYMAAAAWIEWSGTPIDKGTWNHLRDSWEEIQSNLIRSVDASYGVFEGTTFSSTRFADYLARKDIPWPRLASGALALDDETFKLMMNSHPEISPLRELRKTLSALRLNKLSVGSDGRNRCPLSCYRTKTGRNAPSNSKFVFGLPAWIRSLIQPEPGVALSYMDYEQQEFGIAAALSGDRAMLKAYRSGDPYLSFAIEAGAAPRDATKKTHSEIRGRFKVCALAVQYGMGPASLAASLGLPEREARELLMLHHQTYPDFWGWIEGVVDHAMLRGWLRTVFGWRIHVGVDANPRSLMNFLMQANGAEILRLACCLLTERRIKVCAPIHDAVLIEAPTEEIDDVCILAKESMQEASEVVLSGFYLRTEAKIVRHPDRYIDGRGEEMWDAVMGILAGVQPAHESATRCA